MCSRTRSTVKGHEARLISRARLQAFVLVPLIVAAGQQPVAPQPVAITRVTIIDTTGGPAQPDRTVVVREGRITGIETGAEGMVPKDAQLVDGRGKFLIPGLWDMHVHLSWTTASALPVLVANGVTGVRDMGGRLGEIDEWRTKIAAGLVTGPRIVRAGPILNGKVFNPLQMVPGTPEETRGVVRALKAVGVDFIKIHRRLPRDVYFALIDESKKQGLATVGHIPMTVTPEEASDAGQASLEHTETLFEGTFSAALKEGELLDAIRHFRASGAESLFARFVKNKTAVTPTLVAYRSIIEAGDPSLPPDLRRRYVALSLREGAQKQAQPVSAEELAEVKRTFAELREVVRQMNRSGVTLMAGTDTAGPRVPGFSLHDELALLVEAGLTPLQALQAATLTPARFLGKAGDFGAVESGKLADLVLLDANPLDDIRNTQRIAAVVVGGKLLSRRDLETLLREAEQTANRN
ncbi:MAG: amidohydrolase family protein [Thermoanaerobaculia bacterium]